MKLTILALTGAICAMAFGAQAASVMIPNISADSGLVQQAHVTCAYLTSDGYCVRPRSVHRHHYRHLYPYHHDNGLHLGWYKHRRSVVRIVPAYPPYYAYRPHYYDRWNDGWDD